VSNNLSLRFDLVLNIAPLKEQMQTVLNFIKNLQAVSINPKIDLNSINHWAAALERTIGQTDKAESETKQLNQEIIRTSDASKRGFGDALQNLKNFFVLTTTAYLNLKQIVQPIVDFGRESVAAFEKSEIALRKLQNGLKNIGEGADALAQLTNQANQLQQTTPFADEDIVNAQAMLTTFQKGSEEISILTPRLLDLAAAYQTTGESTMNLQQIAVMLGKVNEETIGSLRRVGVAFTKEEEEKLKSLRGTQQTIMLAEILDKNFKGLAETLGNTFAGKIKILSNAWDDVKERIGGVIASALMPVANLFKAIIPVIDSFIAELMQFVQEFGKAVSDVMGGTSTFENFKNTIVDLVQTALARLMQYLRDIQPYYIEITKSVKNLIGEKTNLIDVIKKVIDIVFSLASAFIKYSTAVIQVVTTVMGWLKKLGDFVGEVFTGIARWFASVIPDTWVNSIKSAIQTVLGWMRTLAESPLLRILFPALNFVSLPELSSSTQPPPAGEMGPPPPPKTTAPTTTRTGSSSGTKSKEQEQLEGLAKLEAELAKLQQERTEAETAGHKGRVEQLDKEIAKLKEQIRLWKEGSLVVIPQEVLDKTIKELELPGKINIKEINVDDINRRVQEQGVALKQVELKAQEEIEKKLERQKKLAEQIKRTYQDVITIFDGLNNIVNIIGNKLGESGSNFIQFISQAINLFKELTNILSKQESDEGIGFGDIFGIITSILGFLAEGGPAKRNQPYIVGERGPELFIPDTSGVVLPNSLLGMALQEIRERTNWASRYRASGGAVKAIANQPGQFVVIPDVRISGENIDLVFNRYKKTKTSRMN
jgi:hypothetical protein